MSSMDEIMRMAPVIPVLTIEDATIAAPLAHALVAGGLPVIEVTLRTRVALEALRLMKEVSGAVVGAGTVLNTTQLEDSLKAGADFLVSPGLSSELVKAAKSSGIPFLPGVATATEIMTGMDLGLRRFKFFPGEASGGVVGLKALSGPFPDIRFCPTGGIDMTNARDWLALDAVLCVGGSWLVPSRENLNVQEVEHRARAAAGLR